MIRVPISEGKIVVEMPPGEGPWRMRRWNGDILAASETDGTLYRLELILGTDGVEVRWLRFQMHKEK